MGLKHTGEMKLQFQMVENLNCILECFLALISSPCFEITAQLGSADADFKAMGAGN